MRATLTFNNVYDSDLALTGSAGHDLARAHRLSKLVPPSFIVTSSVYNKFMDLGVEATIKKLLRSKSADEKKIRLLFSATHLPNDLLLELKDAYESLNVGNSSLLSEGEPTVNLFLSPDYYSDYDFSKNIILNITGFSNFIDAIKTLWFRLHLKENVEYRLKNGVEFFSCAIIVQKAVRVESSVEAYTDGQRFFFEAYKGSVDITGKITKDSLVGSFQAPEDYKLKVASQEFKLVHDEKSGQLVKLYLKDKANDIKVQSQTFSEIFRITKKIKYGFSSDIKALFYVDKDRIYLLYVQSLPNLNLDLVEEKEESVPIDLPDLNKNTGEIVYNLDDVESDEIDYKDDDLKQENIINPEVGAEDDFDNKQENYQEYNYETSVVDEEKQNHNSFESEEVGDLSDFDEVAEDIDEEKLVVNDEELGNEHSDENNEDLEDLEDLEDIEDVDEEKVSEDVYDLDKMEAEENSKREISKNTNLPGLDDDFLMEEQDVPPPEDVIFKHTNSEVDDFDEEFLLHHEDSKDLKEDIKVSNEGLGLNSLYDDFKQTVEEFYKDSYGFSPIDKRRALFELNIKYGLKDFEDLVDFDELMRRKTEGHSVDDDLLSRCVESVKRFIKENAKR